jgi:hypothetical protein
MNEDRLLELLGAVRDGAMPPEEALGRLRILPFEDLGFARLDHHRGIRRGMPEVVYAPGKTPAQVTAVVERMAEAGTPVLVSRVDDDVARLLTDRFAGAVHHPDARLVSLGAVEPARGGRVAVVSAGTADIPVAEEAALTAQFAGSPVVRLWDVGVAGLHRLLPDLATLRGAAAIGRCPPWWLAWWPAPSSPCPRPWATARRSAAWPPCSRCSTPAPAG